MVCGKDNDDYLALCCEENQHIPLYMLLDEILNESDVVPVLPFSDIRDNPQA